MFRNTDRDWEYYGRHDPYYGVVSWEKFHAKDFDSDAREEFFRTGENYIEAIFSIIRTHFTPDFFPESALDFGCGTGRLVLPLSKRARHVTGIDVSPSMIEEARRNVASQNCSNVTLLCSGDVHRSLTEQFDFVHSYIVFQHIDSQRGLKITAHLLDRLKNGGIGMLHYTYATRNGWSLENLRISAYRHVPLLNGLRNLTKGLPFRQPPMMMNPYPLNRLFSLLQAQNCAPIHVHFSRHGEPGVLLFFQKKRANLPEF